MKKGEEAVKRLKEIDENKGITGKARRSDPKEVGVPSNSRSIPAEANTTAEQYIGEVLSDADLAAQRIAQAETLKKQAQQLLSEATRLEKEANELVPATNVKTTKTKKTASKQAA